MDIQLMENKILDLMQNIAYKPLFKEDILGELAIQGSAEMALFWKALQKLEEEGSIVCTRLNTYGIPEKMNLIVGTLSLTNGGYGFLIPRNKDIEDIFIPPQALNSAMNNDLVIARLNRHSQGKKSEGEIIRILRRANNTIVGNFTKRKDFAFVLPDDKKIMQDIFIARKNFNGAKDGQKVVAKIIAWPKKGMSAEGEIVEVLGHPSDKDIEIISIIKQHDLPLSFPNKVLVEADKINDDVDENEIKQRRDLRHLLTVTIDSEDAKDLDDAVYVRKTDENNWLLGVYISDVSYYIKKNSILDKDACDRGTSVYLVDRVLPMFPPKISNGICSLNAGVDRLVMACEMTVDRHGKVLDYDIFPSVINVQKRLSYNIVKAILSEKETFSDIPDNIVNMLKEMGDLSTVLKGKRIKRGTVDFDFPEQYVVLDAESNPIEIKQRNRSIAESIIEEFMLLANETVAKHLSDKKVPAIYRVHENPDEEKMTSFSEFLAAFGMKLTTKDAVRPKDLQKILYKISGTDEEKLISKVMLRSLKQAEYKVENIGHFGLAAKYYTHFTSPIRRYPDFIVHRILKELGTKKLTVENREKIVVLLRDIAEHSSKKERIAEIAERETLDLKKAEYMSQYIGDSFNGTISGVTSYGLFIELENGIEGLLHISYLIDDYYIYDESRYCLQGESSKKIYRLGDFIEVEVLQVNIKEREIDFVLPGESDKIPRRVNHLSVKEPSVYKSKKMSNAKNKRKGISKKNTRRKKSSKKYY